MKNISIKIDCDKINKYTERNNYKIVYYINLNPLIILKIYKGRAKLFSSIKASFPRPLFKFLISFFSLLLHKESI